MDRLPRIPSPPRVVFRELRIAVLPFVTFAIVLGLTAITWRSYVGPSMLVGEVETIRTIVNAPQASRLMVLKVGLLDRVSVGQSVAQLLPADPRALASQLSLGRTRIGFIRDSLITRIRQQGNEISYLQLRIDWLDQRADLAALRAQQSYFRLELERQERLAAGANRLNSEAEYEIAKRDDATLSAQIEERASLVKEMEQAISRLIPEESKLNEEAPAALRAALEIEEKELGILEAQLGPIDLVSSLDGVVSAVHRRPGESVAEGDMILTLTADRSERIVAYLRQPINLEIRTNMPVEIRCRGRNREAGLGRVLAVGTQLEPILPELLPRGTSSNVIEYGLMFLVSLPPGVPAQGGEAVDLAFLLQD